jgi:hypothetical protein
MAGEGAACNGVIGKGSDDSGSSAADGCMGDRGREAAIGGASVTDGDEDGQIGEVGIVCSVKGDGGECAVMKERGEGRRLISSWPTLNSSTMHCLFTAFCMRFAGRV